MTWNAGAQRLTASEVWQTNAGAGDYEFQMCSTPYGIRGLAAAVEGNDAYPSDVLNALRHQRFGRADSREQAIRRCQKCSTPYGIRGLAVHEESLTHTRPRVLNALRHQRFGSTYSAANFAPKTRVLNALRHQRFGSDLVKDTQKQQA